MCMFPMEVRLTEQSWNNCLSGKDIHIWPRNNQPKHSLQYGNQTPKDIAVISQHKRVTSIIGW